MPTPLACDCHLVKVPQIKVIQGLFLQKPLPWSVSPGSPPCTPQTPGPFSLLGHLLGDIGLAFFCWAPRPDLIQANYSCARAGISQVTIRGLVFFQVQPCAPCRRAAQRALRTWRPLKARLPWPTHLTNQAGSTPFSSLSHSAKSLSEP